MLKCVKGPQWIAGKHTEGNGRKHLKPVALSTNAKGDLIFLLAYSLLLYFKKRIYFWTSGIFFLFSSSQFFGVFFGVNPPGCIHRIRSPAMWNLKQTRKETDA